MKKEKTTIGIDLKAPKDKCEDKKCPFHGNLKVRGRVFNGVVINVDVNRSSTIEFERKVYVPKFEINEKKRTRLRAHNPSCINAKKGDKVRIAECKPISKTKNFVIIEKIGSDFLFKEKESALEEGKFKEKEKKADKDIKESDKDQLKKN